MDSQLSLRPGHPLYQPPVEVERSAAEHILQQMYGPIVGIERMTREDITLRLPAQYKLV